MSKNIILEVLDDIKHELYLAFDDDEVLEKVHKIIDEHRRDYKGKYNDDIFNELMEER